MRQEFYSIYTQLFDRFANAPSRGAVPSFALELEWRRVIAEQLQSALAKQGLEARLRPDAKYFLLTTLNNMVLRPLVHPDSPRRPDRESLAGHIRQDIDTILESSRAVADEEKSAEISGRMVMTAAVKVWRQLVLHLDDIWG